MIRVYLIIVYTFIISLCIAQKNSTTEYFEAKRLYQQFLRTHSNTIITPNTPLHYLSWGKDTSPTIFWLHGSYSNSLEIEPFAEKFTAIGYQVISMDYYGHGCSPYTADALSLDNLLEDINTLREHLRLDKIVLGGFSRGAYIATSYYKKYPNNVHTLILEDGGVGPFLENIVNMNSQKLKDFVQSELNNRPTELFDLYDSEYEAFEAIHKYAENSPHDLYKNFHSIQLKQNKKYSIYLGLDTIYGMESFNSLSHLVKKKLFKNPFANQLMEVDYNHVIQNITIPTLLLEARGANDFLDDKSYYELLKDNNINIQHHFFKHSNHNIHFDEPKQFISTIINFLNINRP